MSNAKSFLTAAAAVALMSSAWAAVVPNTTTSYTMTGNESFTAGQVHWNKAFNINMGGFTLTMNNGNQTVWFENASDVFRNGTIILDYGYQLCFSKTVTANDNCTVKFKGTGTKWLTLNAVLYAGNLYWDAAPNKFNGSNRIYVKNTFTPIAARFHNVTMQSGSTIDLSSKTGTWSATSSGNQNSDGANVTCTCQFASGSVTVKPGNWALSNNKKVIQWDSAPVPLSTTFTATPEMVSAGLHYTVKNDGLYTSCEPVWAKWDTTSNGWKYYAADNSEVQDWTGGITTLIEVRINSAAELAAIIAATPVTPSKYVYTTQNLTMDCPAQINGMVPEVQSGATIDLKGHKFYISNLNCPAATTIKDTSTGTAGELHAVIAVNQSNSSVALTGNLKLFKEGSATLTATKTGLSYSGGTDIQSGTVTAGGNPGDLPFGGSKTGGAAKIYVRSGTTLNLNGKTGWGYHTVYLDGGTITGATTQPNFVLSLLADSTFNASGSSANVGTDDSDVSHRLSATLNGHTLEIKVKSGYTCFVGTITGPGKINYTAGGWLKFKTANTPADASKRFDFDHGAAVNVAAATDVHNYYAPNVVSYMDGTATLRVFGTFTPTGHSFYGCELQDGSTLDLSGKTAAWSTTRTNTGDNLKGNDTATFAANSEILVKLGGWAGVHGQQSVKVVEWATQPAATVKFVPENSLAAHWYFAKRADGLYLTRKPGVTIVIR